MILILSLLLGFSNGYASSLLGSFPKNWCKRERCSEPQKKIWNDFNSGGIPSWEKMPEVFSGSCYHSSRAYRNTTEHYSGFLIDLKDDGFSFNGSHSFYASQNPYAELDVESARKRFKSANTSRIEVFKDYGFYNANPSSDRPMRYWFREGEDGRLKMAVIFGTLDHFVLCDLQDHGTHENYSQSEITTPKPTLSIE